MSSNSPPESVLPTVTPESNLPPNKFKIDDYKSYTGRNDATLQVVGVDVASIKETTKVLKDLVEHIQIKKLGHCGHMWKTSKTVVGGIMSEWWY